jgi:ParB-like chromosome segregation protein Spo0J
MIEVSKLKTHPKNQEFFDDIYGDKWEDFKKSIARRGVVEAIVITQDWIIVSGHQRVRACREIGILEVPCRVNIYPDIDEATGNSKDDMILEDLISTNILQRGIGNVNPMKMARCIEELERIYEIHNGNHKIKDTDNLNPKTQKDLAGQIGVSQQQLQDYKKLNDLIPELQSLVETGAVKATVGYKIWAKMPQEEQEKFFNEIGKEKIKQMTQKQTQQYIEEKQKLEASNEALTESYNDLSKKFENEQNKEPITVQVDNTDYETINKLNKKVEGITKERDRIKTSLELMSNVADAYEQDSLEYKKMKDDITYLTNQKDDIGRQIKAITDISGLVIEVDHLIKDKLAPVRYSRSLLEAKDDEIVLRNLTDMVETVEQWSSEMRKYIPKKTNYVEVIE